MHAEKSFIKRIIQAFYTWYRCPLRLYNAPHWRHLAPNGQHCNDHTTDSYQSQSYTHVHSTSWQNKQPGWYFVTAIMKHSASRNSKSWQVLIFIRACTSPRNWTWFTRPFFLVRGWGLGTRLKVNFPSLWIPTDTVLHYSCHKTCPV